MGAAYFTSVVRASKVGSMYKVMKFSPADQIAGAVGQSGQHLLSSERIRNVAKYRRHNRFQAGTQGKRLHRVQIVAESTDRIGSALQWGSKLRFRAAAACGAS